MFTKPVLESQSLFYPVSILPDGEKTLGKWSFPASRVLCSGGVQNKTYLKLMLCLMCSFSPPLPPGTWAKQERNKATSLATVQAGSENTPAMSGALSPVQPVNGWGFGPAFKTGPLPQIKNCPCYCHISAIERMFFEKYFLSSKQFLHVHKFWIKSMELLYKF